MPVQYSVQTRGNNSTALLLSFLQILRLLLGKKNTPPRASPQTSSNFEAVWASPGSWCPVAPFLPSRWRSSLSFSSVERSHKPDVQGWTGQRRPACSDGGHVGRLRWDPRCGAVAAGSAPPAALPRPLPVGQTALMKQLVIWFSVCLKAQWGNWGIEDFKLTVGQGGRAGTQRLMWDSRVPCSPSPLAEGGRCTHLLHIQSGEAALKAWHLPKLLLSLKLGSLYWFSKICSFPSQRARHFVSFKKVCTIAWLSTWKASPNKLGLFQLQSGGGLSD